MLPTFFSSAFALWLPVVFGLSVAARHTGPGVLQHAGDGWAFPPGFDRVIRLVELSIAVLLPLPQARFWHALLEHARSISARDFLTLTVGSIAAPPHLRLPVLGRRDCVPIALSSLAAGGRV